MCISLSNVYQLIHILHSNLLLDVLKYTISRLHVSILNYNFFMSNSMYWANFLMDDIVSDSLSFVLPK